MFEVLVGMIASGKSTYAAKRAAAGAVIINADAIVTAIHGGNYKLYHDAYKPVYKGIEHSIASLAVAAGRDVVVDNCNQSVATRARWIAVAKSLSQPCVAVVFPKETCEVHAKRRASADARGYTEEQWLGVAKRHSAQYVQPNESEGFDAIRTPEKL